MPNREFTSSNYRYGFNGKENDREVVGSGSGTQDYGMRIYNPSLGKFLSVDPLFREYSDLSPYQFAGNSPLKFIDLDGLEPASPEDVKKYFKVVNVGEVMFFYDKQQQKVTFTFHSTGTSTRLGFWFSNNHALDIKKDAEFFKDNISNHFNEQVAGENTGIFRPFSNESDANQFLAEKNAVSGGSVGKMFRHIAAQAYLTVKYSEEDAKDFGDTYERYRGVNSDSQYDLINNKRGRDLAKSLKEKYDFSNAEGVAGFLNEVVDITRQNQGLEPLKENEKYFSKESSNVKSLIIPKKEDKK